MAQHLQTAAKRKIQMLYFSGTKPGEIAQKLGIKPASLRQHLYREGLTKRRGEMGEMRQRTAREVLERVRQRSVGDFEAVLELLAEGQMIDAKKLRNAWGFVNGAADLSSLMRAKSLLLDQALRLHGVENADRNHEGGNQIIFVKLERVTAETAREERNVPPAPLESSSPSPA